MYVIRIVPVVVNWSVTVYDNDFDVLGEAKFGEVLCCSAVDEYQRLQILQVQVQHFDAIGHAIAAMSECAAYTQTGQTHASTGCHSMKAWLHHLHTSENVLV